MSDGSHKDHYQAGINCNSCSQSSINARIKYRNKACQLFNTSTEAKALILPEKFAT